MAPELLSCAHVAVNSSEEIKGKKRQVLKSCWRQGLTRCSTTNLHSSTTYTALTRWVQLTTCKMEASQIYPAK